MHDKKNILAVNCYYIYIHTIPRGLLVEIDGPSGESTQTRVAMYIFVDSDIYYCDTILVKALRTIFYDRLR